MKYLFAGVLSRQVFKNKMLTKNQQKSVPIYRFKFSECFAEKILYFSKVHQRMRLHLPLYRHINNPAIHVCRRETVRRKKGTSGG